MAEDTKTWSDIGKPATKGDLITALLQVRATHIHTMQALMAVKQGDNDRVGVMLDILVKDDDRIDALIDKLGGAAGFALK